MMYVAFFVFGVLVFFFDDIVKILLYLKGIKYISCIENFVVTMKKRKKVPISEKIRILENGEKTNIIKKSYGEMKSTLALTGESNKLKMMRVVSVLTGLIGLGLSLYLKNIVIAPILTVGFGLVPMWLTKLSEYRYRQKVNAELSVALSVITTSYIRSENIIRAIEENLTYIRNPVKKPFSDFLSNYKMIDKDITGNIEILSKKIDNKIFKLWCQELTVCQKDITHKHNLLAVMEQLDEDKKIQEKLSLKLQQPIKNILTLMFVSLLAFPVLYIFGNGTLEVLLNTLLGQIFSAALCLCNLMGLNKAISISSPIE